MEKLPEAVVKLEAVASVFETLVENEAESAVELDTVDISEPLYVNEPVMNALS